ncbi:MAG TPA: FAD-dependent oxidoreductase, partial [Clostridia bacterium]|nr:FAD-dependent oxidoreductase [Clostridia bacterium]
SDGTFRVNMSRMQIHNACDPFEVTRAEIEGRDQMLDIMALLRRAIPGCENAELVASASMLGVRESRRIQGDFVLRGEDIKACKQFEDNIFIAGNSVDMHGNGSSVRYEPAKGGAYGVPYRILLPAKVKNLLVAGRASSMDRVVLAAIRVMPPVFAMGQAAGTAAALALRVKTSLSDIPVPELQKMLIADGVLLEEGGYGEKGEKSIDSHVHAEGPVIEE